MTPRPSRLWLLSGLAGAALTLNAQPTSPASPPANAPVASAPAPSSTTPRLVVLGNPNDLWDGPVNAPQLPLKLLPSILEQLTGRTILLAQGLPNPDLPIVFNSAPTRGEFLQAIETVLTMNQLALVPLGPKFLKIVPLGNARIEAPALLEESALTLPPSGQIAAKLFSLQFLRAGEFVPQISNLLNPGSGSPPVIFEKSNAVLITDSISTLQRIEQIIAKTDGPTASGTQAKFYTLTNGAKASDIVTKLRTFLQPMQAQIGSNTSYNADDRTNQIILFSDPRQFPLFDELIAKLDVKSDPNTRNEVIPLKHADATEVSTLLNTLITGQTRATQANGNAQNNNRGRNPAAPTTPDTPPAPNVTAPAGPMIDVGGASNEFSSLVNLQPDVRSNAIVASGTVDDMRLIKQLIEKIDIVLPQVRIEVVIAEVTLSDAASSGISALGLAVQNGKLIGAIASGPGTSIGGLPAANDSTSPTGFASATGKFDLSAVISLSTTPRKNNSVIFSVPSITTMHNKEGEIFFGETRPIISSITSSATGSNSNGLSSQSSVTQQEIGTTVTVKPLIGYDGSVQMEIKQEISDVGGEVLVGQDKQYIINKRKTSSFFTARSGEILVMGGIQKRTNSRTTSRLGPIPFIGDLLGSRSRREDRTELVFFIRPTVLTNTDADNAQAMQQVENMPNKEAVKKVLQPAGTLNEDKKSDGPVLNRKK
ncbi:type II secretory pathway, component PulD [Nibricoccus aquaticus]|uniref:Type II secretory pathway, component PulD n=1 Tax=Nibricoccus aquaticus TaxID=2576891 RepID=A0A290Q7E8_9BACT|nr:secretin N-terminal domain-containing protein [Nibricoccus aquaticus]ATC64579.1 type II secretory pathway, component PulD [Nibricoccus aquaticus]